jgi:hypothetical protein
MVISLFRVGWFMTRGARESGARKSASGPLTRPELHPLDALAMLFEY